MGIQGFTKFINDRAHLYYENHELRDCNLIIDGHSISCQLYNWKHWQYDARSVNCYGGDYDKYVYIVENFFGMLQDVRVKPIVIFDGGFEQRKLPTILKRMQDKLNVADQLNPAFEAKNPFQVVFPLFLREAFKDILRNLDIEMVMCEYEGDQEISNIAKSLNCPVLTFDSDYFIFGAQYIPFKTLESKVRSVENWRTGTYKCISCKLYKIEKLLEDFKGLEESTLHLLPVLLGNDYIDQRIFSKFLLTININEKVCLQDKVKLILDWLKTQSPEMAVRTILKSFKTNKEQEFILNKIEKIVTGYYFKESKIFKYLDVKVSNKQKFKEMDFDLLKEQIKNYNDLCDNDHKNATEESTNVTNTVNLLNNNKESVKNGLKDHEEKTLEEQITSHPVNENDTNLKNKETENNTLAASEVETIIENGEISLAEAQSNSHENEENLEYKEICNNETLESVDDDTETEKLSSPLPPDIFSFEETHLEKANTSANPISKTFKKNFLKCLYPSSFMDILTQNIYYCIPQVENYSEQNSHKISFDILRAIHKILTNSGEHLLTIVGRGEGTKVQNFPQEKLDVDVPNLDEIEQLTLQGRRNILFQILNLDNNFVTLLDHFPTEWHTFLISLKFASTKTTLQTPLIYSLILCFIILNYIDQRIGFYRSMDRYKQKYYALMQNLPPSYEHVPFRADKNCFYYFPYKDCIIFMQKVIHLFTSNPQDDFDKKLLHQMAQIQSVLLHIKYLNSLLKNPYPNLIIHQIFDATFIYNLTKIFREKSSELENNYLNVFFKDCPSILAGLKYVLNMLSKQLLML